MGGTYSAERTPSTHVPHSATTTSCASAGGNSRNSKRLPDNPSSSQVPQINFSRCKKGYPSERIPLTLRSSPAGLEEDAQTDREPIPDDVLIHDGSDTGGTGVREVLILESLLNPTKIDLQLLGKAVTDTG